MGDMDKKIILIKTDKGESEVSGMSGDAKRVLLLIDGHSTYAEIIKHAPPSLRGDLPEIIQRLLDSELIRDKSRIQVAPRIVTPKAAPKSFIPHTDQKGDELDFTSMFIVPDAVALATEAAKVKAAQEAIKLKENQAVAKQKAEAEARAKAEVEARARAEQAAARVKAELEAAAKAKAVAEAAKLKAEQAAARIKAELEAAKAKAEVEAKALAEERARNEAEAARVRAEAEAVRIKAEQETARIKAEQEAARINAEQEVARIKAEQEAAQVKAEQEAAEKARAEAETRAREAAQAAKLKAELEEAKAKAEVEAKALAAERERQQAEAARLQAEQEAARVKAEQEAVERAQAEAVEAERRKAEAEAVRLRQEQEAVERAKAEAEALIKAEQEAARVKAEAARIEEEQVAAPEAEERASAEAEVARNRDEADAAQAAQTDAKKEAAPAGFHIDLGGLSAMDSSTEADQLARPASSTVEETPVFEAPVEQKEPEAKQDIAAEMARLKAEQEAERLRAEQEVRAGEEEQALAAEQESAWDEAKQRAEQQRKLDAVQVANEAALAEAKSKQQTMKTRRRHPLPLGKITAGILTLGVVAIFVVPMFWPMQEYIAPLEQRLAERFKQPVKVGGMSASLLPIPKIELVEVKVGAAGEFTADVATLNFDLSSLLSDSKLIDEAVLQGATLKGSDLGKVAGWFSGMGGDAQFPLQHVTLHDLKIVSDEIAVPPLQGGADFDQGEFSRLVLHSNDEKFNVEINAVANRMQLAFGIRDGSLPLLPAAMFSSFNARGELNADGINISDLDAHAYGGIWSGKGKVSWYGGWIVDASIQAKTMELSELFPKYGLTGEVFINGELSGSSRTLQELTKSLRVDASFEAKRGVINGIDMVETARLASHEHLVGGRTHFDELNGSFVADGGRIRFRSMRITSGMLKASGTLDVATDGQIFGVFNSEIKMRSGNNPLLLSGTLTEPVLKAR